MIKNIKIKDNKYVKLLLVFLGLLLPVAMEKFIYINEGFSIIRCFFNVLLFEFTVANIYLDLSKLWDAIYKYRYYISICLFSILVLLGVHGSSIGIYEEYVEPSYKTTGGVPIVGVERAIRSDEWMVTSPNTLSQTTELNNLNETNVTMMGKKQKVSFFPVLPTKTIGILATPKYVGYLFLPRNQAFSFAWLFPYFALLLGAFEFFMILTKKNKFWSLVGAMMMLFAPPVQWWESTNIISSGMWAMVFFYKFLNSKKILNKVCYAMLIGWMGSIYIMSMYPAWMIPYGYVFLSIVIWMMVDNKGKFSWKHIMLLIGICLTVIIGLILPKYLGSSDIYKIVSNTVYPGQRFELGGRLDNFGILYYIVSIFLPFGVFGNPCIMAQYVCFFPIPLVLGILYLYNNFKNKKNDLLLLLLMIVIVFLTLWCVLPFPRILAKVTMLYMSPVQRTILVVGYATLILLIYCLSNYSTEKKEVSKYYKFVIALFTSLFFAFLMKLSFYSEVSTRVIIAAIVVYTILNYAILLNNKKLNKYLGIILIILSIITGLSVHPITRTTDVIYKKPLSSEIKKIVQQDPNAEWIGVDTSIILTNYVVANGARIINSTNYYPNFDLWKKIDKKGKYEDIWNRYAHIGIWLTKKNTKIILGQTDVVLIELNNNDVCKIDADYIISEKKNLEKYSDDSISIAKIYDKENIFIYKVKCN